MVYLRFLVVAYHLRLYVFDDVLYLRLLSTWVLLCLVLVFLGHCVVLVLTVVELLTFYTSFTVSHVLTFCTVSTCVMHASTYVFSTQVEKKRK